MIVEGEDGERVGGEGGKKYKASSDNREAEDANGQQRSAEAATQQTNRIGQLRGTGVGGWMAFFFFFVLLVNEDNRGLCSVMSLQFVSHPP